MNKYLKIVCLTLSMGMGFGLSNIAKADGHSVMFASWGGSFQDALRTTMLTPAAEKLGISPRTLRYKINKLRDLGMAVPTAYARV